MKKKHFYFFVGTTAELIKFAPVIHEFQKRKISFKIITSGQNKVNFEEFSTWLGLLRPDISFREKENKSSAFIFLFWAIKTFFSCLWTLREEFKELKKNNSYFIVHGDTVSALIGALVAKIYNLKLVHVESGLYSHNFLEPLPEEICRNLIDRLADILCLSNTWAKSNVRSMRGEKVFTKENTLIESFLWSTKVKPVTPFIKNIKRLKKYYILIMHRQEHVIFRKEWSEKILRFVIRNANKNLNCVLLGHPLTVKIIKSLKINPRTKTGSKIIVTPRIPYPDFMKLMKNAEFIATDGCINQLEAYYMGLPCLALRDLTEQPEGIDRNVVLCKSDEVVMKDFFANYEKYRTKPVRIDVRPSKIIVDYLLRH